MTALLYASKWNNIELVKLLLEKGANINAKAKDGSTALTIAQINGYVSIYNYLSEHGAPELKDTTIPPSPPNTGIAPLLDNRMINFQPGTYRLYGHNIDIKFVGNKYSGNISYRKNGIQNYGFYRIDNNTIIITMEGKESVYTMDSNTSFSGNGERWTRTGN